MGRVSVGQVHALGMSGKVGKGTPLVRYVFRVGSAGWGPRVSLFWHSLHEPRIIPLPL